MGKRAQAEGSVRTSSHRQEAVPRTASVKAARAASRKAVPRSPPVSSSRGLAAATQQLATPRNRRGSASPNSSEPKPRHLAARPAKPPARAKPELERVKKELARWHEETLGPLLQKFPERQKEFSTTSSHPVRRLYTPVDLADWEYESKLGFPGEFPYTRGAQATMYRGRLWTMRQFAGFGTPEETNARFHFLRKQGQNALSVAFDLPTLYGEDADSPAAEGEVGMCGVACSSLEDMQVITRGLPLGELTTSMTINSPAAVVWAFYIAAAESQGVPMANLGGTLQNDILKEYIAQKEFLYPPEPSMRLVTDTIEFGTEHMPKWNTVSISGYHIREAGATAAQELAFTLADGMEYVRWAKERGLDLDAFAARLSFFFNAHNDLFEELAKYRAARRIWANFMRHDMRAKSPRSWMLRFHTQTAGVSCTAQQPEINIVRTTVQALAAVMGGTNSLHTNSFDEALALPTEKAVRIALRTQQILAHESGVANTIDPMAGSYFLESLTDELEEEAYQYFDRIESLGGVLPAISRGFMQREIADSAYKFQRDIESKSRIMVGVNDFTQGNEEGYANILDIDSDKIRAIQSRKLAALRRRRDRSKVEASLEDIRSAAGVEDDNLMPHFLKAVKNWVTVGEICGALRDVWGDYREPPDF